MVARGIECSELFSILLCSYSSIILRQLDDTFTGEVVSDRGIPRHASIVTKCRTEQRYFQNRREIAKHRRQAGRNEGLVTRSIGERIPDLSTSCLSYLGDIYIQGSLESSSLKPELPVISMLREDPRSTHQLENFVVRLLHFQAASKQLNVHVAHMIRTWSMSAYISLFWERRNMRSSEVINYFSVWSLNN